MSAIRNPATITSVGRRMMTAGGDITYTKAVLYGQDISHLTREQLESLTSIGNPLVTVPLGISDKNDNGNGTTVILEATFQNSNLKADLPYTAVGFFAKRGDDAEKLIAVGVATEGAYLAATSPDGVATDALDIKVAIAIGDSANVTAMIDPAGSVTPAALHNAITDVKSEMKTGLDTKADKTDVASDVKSLNDAINTKASQADLDKTNAVVATKANATALADYARTVDVDADLDTKANKTDLESLAKTADVNSALDTKADKATVNSDIKTINDTMATKADKTTVDGDVKTLQASIDTKADKTALDDYAKSADVASDVKTLTDSIATKADAKTVNDAISKIDFTPYAKSADVTALLKGYTDTADLTKLLAGKADSDFSYSKAELDKKLLDLTTTTGGKVDANQVATMIENKADKSDVTKQIGTITDLVNIKANSTDVDAALDKKDDITDVDAKIKTVTDLANQVSQKADDNFNKRPVINGVAGDDLFAYKSNQLRLYPGNGRNCKNLPLAGNNQWYTVEYIFEAPNNDGVAIYRSPLPEIWVVGNNGGTFGTWHKLANDDDFNNLKNQINTKANSSDVYVRKDVDSAFGEVRDRIGKLEGSQTVDSPDFNNLTASGVYYITNNNGANIKNNPVSQWGVLIVSNGDGHRISQVYYPDDGNPPWYRSLDESTWRPWYQLSTRNDVGNASNAANAASNKVDTVLANSYVCKQGMNANGDCVEIKHTGIKQANGGYAFDMWSDDWTASKLQDVIKNQLPSKANTADVNNALNDKANAGDVSALQNKVNVSAPLFREISADSTWEDIFGVTNPANVLTSLRINPGGNGQLANEWAAGIGFGGKYTKAVISVDCISHVARFTAGNGTSPGWSEDVAWKSDVTNLQNQVNTKASASDVNSLNQTISALQQTVQSLQNTVNQQATTITGLQTLVNNQAQDITYIKANYIEGKRFAKADESQATAWEKENSQRIAFITDN